MLLHFAWFYIFPTVSLLSKTNSEHLRYERMHDRRPSDLILHIAHRELA